jgi:hypothetical protein
MTVMTLWQQFHHDNNGIVVVLYENVLQDVLYKVDLYLQ